MKSFPIEAYEIDFNNKDNEFIKVIDYETLLAKSHTFEDFISDIIMYFCSYGVDERKVTMLRTADKYIFDFSFFDVLFDKKGAERTIEAMFNVGKILPSDDYFLFRGDIVKYEILLTKDGFSLFLYQGDITEPFSLNLFAVANNFKEGV